MNAYVNDLYTKSLDEYIAYFLQNRSYKNLKEVQDSRANIKIINVSEYQITDQKWLKHKFYDDVFKSIYITLPYDFLICGERINFRDIRKIRYQLLDISQINALFGNNIDLFYDGKKIKHTDLKIALFDNYFLVQVPAKYKECTKMVAMMRPYVKDFVTNQSRITVYNSEINNTEMGDFLVYIDGVQTEKYSVVKETDHIVIQSQIYSLTTMEVTYIRNLNRFGSTHIVNSHLDLRSVRGRYPISVDNILTFSNGLFVNLSLEPKTGNIIKSNISLNNELLLYYVYLEYPYEKNYYDDNYSWYGDYNKNLMDIINSSSSLPAFMNSFRLFDKDICLSDYIANKYPNLEQYNIDRSKDTIMYNEELIIDIYRFLLKNLDSNKITRKQVYLKDYDLVGNLRNDNTVDNTDPSRFVSFISPMYLFKLPNINKYSINVYIDGIRYFDFVYLDRISDVDYIYLKASRLTDATMVEFEFINTSYTSLRKVNMLGDGSNTMVIENAKLLGLINDSSEERYIRALNITRNTECTHTDIIYDSTKDMLTITVADVFRNGDSYIIENINFHKKIKKDTKRRSSGFTIPLTGLENMKINKNNIRLFKTGREIPRNYYTITQNNITDVPVLTANVTYTIYELMEIEFIPNKIIELNYQSKVLDNVHGKIDLYNDPTTQNGDQIVMDYNQYYTINGRRIMKEKYKLWCTKGMTLSNLISQKHFTIMLNDDDYLRYMMTTFYNLFKDRPKEFAAFIVSIMSGGPLTDTEGDCTETNITRTGELYYDLYQEFLKHNIIDIGKPLPAYIAFKYNPLVDEGLNNTLMLNMSEKQLYWMPLDATMTDDDHVIRILDLYYRLLDDIHSIQVVDPANIPTDLYNTYAELFQNNVLILQVPTVPQP